MEEITQENIHIKLPVKIKYKVLEAILREKAIGESLNIEKENGEITRYIEILDISLAESPDAGYDLALDVKFKTLISLMGNKSGSILLDVALDFDEEYQEISVSDYKLRGNSRSWFLNRSLEAVANRLIKNKLRNKMRFDFRPILEKQLFKVNDKLQDNFQPAEGINLEGSFNDFKIHQIIPGNEQLSVLVGIRGMAFVEVKELNFGKAGK